LLDSVGHSPPSIGGGGRDCAREGVSVAKFGLGLRSFDLFVSIWDLEMPFNDVLSLIF
jgi:hypothetical protein